MPSAEDFVFPDLGERATLLLDKHAEYVIRLNRNKGSYEWVATEHFRMSGVYWGLMAMCLMDKLDQMDNDDILVCMLLRGLPQAIRGGASSPDLPPPPLRPGCCVVSMKTGALADPRAMTHTCSTHSVQSRSWPCKHRSRDAKSFFLLGADDATRFPIGSHSYGKLELLDADKVAAYVRSLQQPDGSFVGDPWGEVDTRFTYCAASPGCLPAFAAALEPDATLLARRRCSV